MVRHRPAALLLMVGLTVLVAPCAGQRADDDEFSLLGIPRPGAMLAGFGLPPAAGGGFSKLLQELEGDEAAGQAAAAPARRVHVLRLPPVLSGLFRRADHEQARPAVTMRFRPMAFAMPSLSLPLQKLSALADGCEPCGRVQSHMRSISIMHGPNGQRVETVTETDPDGEEHTTRTVTSEDEQASSQDTGDDLLDAVLSPLMGGLPDFGRIIEAAEQETRSAGQPGATKPAVPKEAPQVAQAPKEVTNDEAKQAVKAAVKAEGLDVGSPEKRQDLAWRIAQQLGVSPDAVKVSSPQDDSEADTEESSEDADELGKEFDEEEQERKDILRREKSTMGKVSQAAESARAKASEEAAAADHLEALQRHMQSLSPVN